MPNVTIVDDSIRTGTNTVGSKLDADVISDDDGVTPN